MYQFLRKSDSLTRQKSFIIIRILDNSNYYNITKERIELEGTKEQSIVLNVMHTISFMKILLFFYFCKAPLIFMKEVYCSFENSCTYVHRIENPNVVFHLIFIFKNQVHNLRWDDSHMIKISLHWNIAVIFVLVSIHKNHWEEW